MITIGAVLLIVLIYALVIARKFFKDTELTKEVKDKMLLKAFKAGFITVLVGWGFFELFMIMRIEPSYDTYRFVMFLIIAIAVIIFGLCLKVQEQRPD